MTKVNFKIQIYLDGASIEAIKKYKSSRHIKGFTTNPSLMRKEKIRNYKDFALAVLKIEKKKPISFEVFADDINEMKLQAIEIASWGKNVFVKIPITNTKGESTARLINELNEMKIKCNVTAIFTLNQINEVIKINRTNTLNILVLNELHMEIYEIILKMISKLKKEKTLNYFGLVLERYLML